MRANRERNTHDRRGIAAVTGLVVVGAAGLLGCGQLPDADAGPTGRATLALQTTASDGASYRFAAGSLLGLYGPTGDGLFTALALDGTETTVTVTLPIGSYTVKLINPGGRAPLLVRTLNDVSQTLPATWNDPQPVMVSIVENMTTPLTLHFSATGLGDVTFQTGRLQTSIDVSPKTTTMANHGLASLTFTGGEQSIAAGLGLETALGLVAGERDSGTLTFDLISPFAVTRPEVACAKITATWTSSPSASAAFGALMAEEGDTGTAGHICVGDDGANDWIQVVWFRNGAAPVDQRAFLRGTNYSFGVNITVALDNIFDGTTFQQSQLATPITLGAAHAATLLQEIDDLDTQQTLESCSGALTGTFQLTP